MNRDEVVNALLEFPPTAEVSVANVGPNDVIVLEHPDHLSRETAERLSKMVQEVWPGRKCVVLTDGLKMSIAKESPEAK